MLFAIVEHGKSRKQISSRQIQIQIQIQQQLNIFSSFRCRGATCWQIFISFHSIRLGATFSSSP